MTGGSNSIMIVDPSKTWRTRGCNVLRAGGYTVAGFSSGTRALQHLRSHAVDLVVADFMSLKKNLFRWRKLAKNQSRLVFLIRSQKPELIAECFRCGADDYALKPVNERGLFDIVDRAMNRSTVQTGSS